MNTGSDFWSRRKAAVRAEQQALAAQQDRATGRATGAGAQPVEPPAQSDEDILRGLGLKDPDRLEPGDDFSGYLDKTLPGHLHQRALRRLWSSDPSLAGLDGLVDYGEDFTGTAPVAEAIRTVYALGRNAAGRADGDTPATAAAPRTRRVEAEEAEKAATTAEIPAADRAEPDPVAAPPAAPVRRHMRFSYPQENGA